MDETNELLVCIYQDCEMAVFNLENLLNELLNKDNKIKSDIEFILKEYEKYFKETKKLMKENKIKPQKSSMMAKMGSKIGIKNNVKKDNSDSKISDIVIQGLVMGIIDINKRIDNYKEESGKDTLMLAKRLLSFQEDSVDKLKEYL